MYQSNSSYFLGFNLRIYIPWLFSAILFNGYTLSYVYGIDNQSLFIGHVVSFHSHADSEQYDDGNLDDEHHTEKSDPLYTDPEESESEQEDFGLTELEEHSVNKFAVNKLLRYLLGHKSAELMIMVFKFLFWRIDVLRPRQ